MPEVVVRRLRRALEDDSGPDQGPSAQEVARVRDRVPARHRDEFDALLAETRLTSRVRDERGIFSEVRAGGTRDATTLIRDGALVRVDGQTGAVEILG